MNGGEEKEGELEAMEKTDRNSGKRDEKYISDGILNVLSSQLYDLQQFYIISTIVQLTRMQVYMCA